LHITNVYAHALAALQLAVHTSIKVSLHINKFKRNIVNDERSFMQIK